LYKKSNSYNMMNQDLKFYSWEGCSRLISDYVLKIITSDWETRKKTKKIRFSGVLKFYIFFTHIKLSILYIIKSVLCGLFGRKYIVKFFRITRLLLISSRQRKLLIFLWLKTKNCVFSFDLRLWWQSPIACIDLLPIIELLFCYCLVLYGCILTLNILFFVE